MIFESALICLALNVYHEARGEPIAGQLAVAHVTRNRAITEEIEFRHLDSICAVVKQSSRKPYHKRACAFSWYCDGRADKPLERAAWRESLAIAHDVITGASEDTTGYSLWYHKSGLKMIWASRLAGKQIIGSHVFYNIRRKNTRF